MSGYVLSPPKDHRFSGGELVDIHAQRWAEYKDLPLKEDTNPNTVGCVFAKSCELPDGIIDHIRPAGFIPVEKVANYGEFAIFGGREADADGNIPLKKISGSALPAALGTLLLGGAATAAGTIATGASAADGADGADGAEEITAGVAVGALAGVVTFLWSSSVGDSSLYSEEQLQSLKQARTRVRLHVEQQADGTLKGYGYNTQTRTDWEMIPVVQFVAQGSQQVAVFGDGVTLTWTPASISRIPSIEGAPQVSQIWIYPPTEQADNIIVSPIYPDKYKDFILIFPTDSGVPPLYVVMNIQLDPDTCQGVARSQWLLGFKGE